MTTRDWLDDVVLVNDNETETPGDVMLFRNFSDARSYLEHWADELDQTAYFANGDRLIIAADSHGNVSLSERERREDGADVVSSWLKHLAAATLSARHHRSSKRWKRVYLGELEAQGVLPQTIEGLIAYVGFTI
jgi:hypothetical protein